MLKRLAAILFLAVVGAASVAVFRGSRLLDEARDAGDAESRAAILEREQKVVPIHAEIYAGLGKAYFEMGLARMADPEKSAAAFERCDRSYLQALALDPFNAFTHFEFAQALLYMNHMSLAFPTPGNFEEFKRSAALASHAPQIYFEVSKILLSRWSTLAPEEQAFAIETLKLAVARTDAAGLMSLFHLWELSAPDFKSVEKILPRDRAVYRQFAQFLGERSLDRNERLSFLSQAESMDFQSARSAAAAGQNALQQFRLKEAEAQLKAALDSLAGIRFYQSLVSQALIDPLEFQMLEKDIHLALAKCGIEQTRDLNGAIPALRAYLALEDRPAAVSELERFLKERGFLQGKSAAAYKDFSQTSFEALMAFKQNRYRDIIDVGTSLEQDLLVIPEAMKPEYARILELVGDSYQKLDFIYESNKFYQKAISAGGEGLMILLKIRRNLERLNDLDQMKAINAEIAKLLSPRDIQIAPPEVAKGQSLDRAVTLAGGKAALILNFGPFAGEPRPLVSVFLNGHVLWEDFVKDVPLVLQITPNTGVNSLSIVPVNQGIVLKSLTIVPEGQEVEKGVGAIKETVPGRTEKRGDFSYRERMAP